ncbi:glycine hydroxymethyltransferase [Treponema phagedenis]|uniref:Serine hydroxymethyltransferase n=1 Tax=Treponema phagedenis TaxID=162 RepID=A0A0B7GS79_TREPH|nr:glycine hydroxymethyltransferase [Treponema phagedenis]NVP24426.1 glycine hydroxymethyltransferase [Treponema phagedenis]QEJ96488.1 glycine hydroxymethyltransferase [Treponema phagedenis]QEJ97812.1 glycine hydroxymethyltransferase [Treponema phagedenis]QEK02270.1 glycine hydroxymethyltransferase [Treponema phagedenis]QEK05161.1 glycine hydroxymethyltransferase [Treponema phagedenis]
MKESGLQMYLKNISMENINTALVAYLANLDMVAKTFPEIAENIVKEFSDQRTHLKLIASENYCSLSVQAAMGNLLTDKYAEGYPEHRYYGGCQNIDAIESAAAEEAKLLFGAEYAYVQPHAGADANITAYWAILSAKIEMPALEKIGEMNVSNLTEQQWEALRQKLGNQKLMGLDYYSGGHLTHGYRQNISARMFQTCSYTVDKKTGLLDYDQIEEQALKEKPLILLAGYSAYPRSINFRKFKEIAEKAGAVLMVDMAHFAGLVAGKVFTGDEDPVRWADIVTTTTHKTLRGPRGALILCKKEFADVVNKGCPLVLGGPLPHMMAAKAIAFREAQSKAYQDYAHQVRDNARALADAAMKLGMRLQTGGTDNHLMLIDVQPFGLTGRQAETAMTQCGITLNRNALPFDPNGAWFTSGLRIGTPAVTTLGMKEPEMQEIAEMIYAVLKATKPAKTKSGGQSRTHVEIDSKVKIKTEQKVKDLLKRFVLYPELDLELLKRIYIR